MIMHTLKNGFQVCDAGKYGRYETDCADTCIVYLFHGGNSAFNADCGIHFVFEILIKRIYRPRNGNLPQLFQQVNVTHYQIGLRADQDIRTAADKLLQQLSCIAKPLLLRIVSVSDRANYHSLTGILLRIFYFRPTLNIEKSSPFFSVSSKAFHKGSIAVLTGMGTSHVGIHRISAHGQTGFCHDIFCFDLTDENAVHIYLCHALCSSNTLLKDSGSS